MFLVFFIFQSIHVLLYGICNAGICLPESYGIALHSLT